ncbi:Phenylacetyl-CoA ligase [Mycena chlorophos]|uniref:Phenylacetyl-CoA ligase n=1 Tax=Mycena chlorophos TaxID=658473 RepID=A0A8H6SPC5_MYCCL|nr:Phenylacetyl-CoA ligase [Mycena chlorophos]
MSTLFTSPAGSLPLPFIPDNVTIPQFMLETPHSARPHRPASAPWLIEDGSGRRIGLDELRSRTSNLANALSIKWRIHEESVVCLFTPNHVDYPVCIWAVHTLGAIVTPSNPSYTSSELTYQLAASKASLLFTSSESLPIALSAARQVGLPDDRVVVIEPSDGPRFTGKHETIESLVQFGNSKPANFIQRKLRSGEGKTKIAFYSFSSGTTGTPKGVQITHYGVIANILQKAAHFRIADPAYKQQHMRPGDVAIAVLPFFHIFGLVVVLHYMLFAGTSLVVVPKFNFAAFLDSITRHKVTCLYLVPPQIVLLCKHPATAKYDLSHVRMVISGAAPLSGELVQTLSKTLPNAAIGQGYGATETGPTVTNLGGTQRMGTLGGTGPIVPGTVVRIRKADGSYGKEGELGEILVSGPAIPLGYLNNAKATKETFADGWVHTGDEGYVKDSEIFVVDRIKELIKVKGNQVSPADLEGHLLLHPAVTDACVVSILDDYTGEAPLAYVVLSEEAQKRVEGNQKEAEALKNALKKHVADHKVEYKRLTGGVVFINAIPKNPSGKILRRTLRDEARKTYKMKSRL